MTKQNLEQRIQATGLTTRAEGSTPGLSGYAVKFDDITNIGGQFDEVVSRDAFGDTDLTNVFALYNHDWNQPLAKTGAGLDLTIDDTGLRFDLDLPDTTAGRDIQELVKRGVIEGMSFGFTIAEDEWEQRDASPLRKINRIDELFEITVTHIPAYPTTEVGMRSMGAALNEEPPSDVDSQPTIAEVASVILTECPDGMELKDFLEQLATPQNPESND